MMPEFVRGRGRRLAIGVVMLALTISAFGDTRSASSAPNFTLKSAAGTNLRLSEYRGQVVMINFWASWCGPCRQEMPVLEGLYQRYRPIGFALLGVSIDEHPVQARAMARRLAVSYPILFDTGKQVSRLYDVSAMPMTVILDRDGRLRYAHRGYLPGFEHKYEQQIRGLLRE